MKEKLINKLDNKSAVIGVVGLGYVGIPLSLRFFAVGYKVIDFDIDPEKTEKISACETYIKRIGAKSIKAATNADFEAATDFYVPAVLKVLGE